MKNFRSGSRRKFIWMIGTSSIVAAFGGLSRRSLAQGAPVANPGSLNQKRFRLPQNTQLLLRDIKRANPNDPASLSRSRKVAPQELESAFDKLNDAFSFNQSSGQLIKNPAIELNSDEEQLVNQLLAGYQRQVQTGEIKLRRGANNLFIPLPAEPEIDRQGVVTQIPQSKDKSAEKLSKQQKISDLSPLSPEFDTNSNPVVADSYLIAQGCGWQWWKKAYWWGVRISFNKTAVNWLTSAAGAASAVLAVMKITGPVAAAIAAGAGILKAISNQNGVRIYVTWTGQFWALPKPTSSGGC